MDEHKSQDKNSWFDKNVDNINTNTKMQFNEDIAKELNQKTLN